MSFHSGYSDPANYCQHATASDQYSWLFHLSQTVFSTACGTISFPSALNPKNTPSAQAEKASTRGSTPRRGLHFEMYLLISNFRMNNGKCERPVLLLERLFSPWRLLLLLNLCDKQNVPPQRSHRCALSVCMKMPHLSHLGVPAKAGRESVDPAMCGCKWLHTISTFITLNNSTSASGCWVLSKSSSSSSSSFLMSMSSSSFLMLISVSSVCCIAAVVQTGGGKVWGLMWMLRARYKGYF